jgi:hypothetical protein
VVGFGVAVLVFGAALAFAASGGVSLPFVSKPPAERAKPSSLAGDSPPVTPPPDTRGTPNDRAQAATPATAGAAPANSPSSRAAAKLPGASPALPAATGAAASAPPVPEATWADVSRALAANDDKHAKQALESLGKSDDPRTRATARLGLAQLMASRGDCKKAYALAIEVAASSEADPRTAARARALAARCAQ